MKNSASRKSPDNIRHKPAATKCRIHPSVGWIRVMIPIRAAPAATCKPAYTGISTLQTQLTNVSSETQYTSGSFQARCEANVSIARKRPDAIRQANPPYMEDAYDSDRANFRTAIAKNKAAKVGKITLPTQLVKFRSPFVNDIFSLCLHRKDQFPNSRNA